MFQSFQTHEQQQEAIRQAAQADLEKQANRAARHQAGRKHPRPVKLDALDVYVMNHPEYTVPDCFKK